MWSKMLSREIKTPLAEDGCTSLSESSDRTQHQQQQQIQEDAVTQAEVAMQGEIINMRVEAVARVARDVRIVNDTYKTMSILAMEQSEGLDNIEENMRQTADNMEGLVEQLEISGQAQQKKNKYIYCMLVAAVLMAIIVVFVVLSSRD